MCAHPFLQNWEVPAKRLSRTSSEWPLGHYDVVRCHPTATGPSSVGVRCQVPRSLGAACSDKAKPTEPDIGSAADKHSRKPVQKVSWKTP